MKNYMELTQAAETEQSRRKFIKNTGTGIIAATVIGSIVSGPEAHGQKLPVSSNDPMDETKPVTFTPIEHPTENPKPAVPSPMRPSKRIGYAIVGLGRLSLNQILPALVKCKKSIPVALVSGDKEKAKKVAIQYGINEKNIYNYQNFDDIKNNPDIDVVYIVLPNSMHEEFTIRTAKAGKHVLCEKPMATSSASAQRMIDACKKANVKLMIAYRIQYEPNNKKVKEWVRSQKFGKARIINSFNGQNSGDPNHWRLKKALAGGGSLPDIGLYCLNTTRYLLGEEPETIIATTYSTPGDERFKEVEESVMFQMIFPSGTISTNTCSYGIHTSRYYKCHADKGGTFGVMNAYAYGGLQLEESHVEDKMEYKSMPSTDSEKDQFALEMDHMSDCVLNNKIPYTPGEEGLQDQKIMEAIYEAARTNKPVKMPKVDKLDAFRGSEPTPSE